MKMTDEPIYLEEVSSNRTEALFVVLAALFFVLYAGGPLLNSWRIVSFCLFIFFVFYALNFRTLTIRLSKETLHLKFGIFTWTVPLHNVEACFPDGTSLWRIGGAGIHFTFLGGRYRAMCNFLEHPRVVITLKAASGPVRDIAFSTRRPGQVIGLIRKMGDLENAV